ncbi:MAG TPA: HlyD family type I secretion periplasmic adaptor subunit [Stellaceae bacterium]|jgi:adhesin transport system membrane fusion protein|nr:HlyD family type I secretion periplasmic adaptor subunit [Stellaceae bacterium]
MSHKIDSDFLPDYDLALRARTARFAHILTLGVCAFCFIFLIWAHFAKLDEVTRGDARVVPSSKIQVVQNLEGGILAELAVRDNQIVQKGDVLLRIANTSAESQYRDSRTQYLTLEAMIARLKAEIADTMPQFPQEVLTEAPTVAHSEQALYGSQLDQFKSNIAVLNDQLAQKQQEIAGLQSKQDTLSRSLALAKQERDMTSPLVASGAASKLELVKLERELTDLQGQIDDAKISITQAEAARNEAQKRIQEKTATFHSDAQAELNKHTAELAALSQQIFAQHDRVTRTEVRSPVRGTIKDVKVTTIGEVIKPGEDLVEIVPLEDTLLVEAKIRPADVAFLHPGQPAMVKVSAYDFSIYGGLKAQVEDISADTIKDDERPNGGTFFRVTLRTEKNSLGTADKPLPIIPGMTASAEILTGQKSVLDYLLKPLLKARDEALHER